LLLGSDSASFHEINSHPDFIRITREEGAREIVVKQARELLTRMQLTSARGGYKVALIEEADRLNEEAANALLKAVEEPSPNTVYLFLAEQPDRLPATLRSRLVKMEFGRVPTKTIEGWLRVLSSRTQSDGERDLDRSDGAARSFTPSNSIQDDRRGLDSVQDDKEGGDSFGAIAIQSRGCPGTAFRLAFASEDIWYQDVDWQKILDVLLAPYFGKQLAAIETLAKTIESQSDPETAWHEALDHLMRGLDTRFAAHPTESVRLAEGLSRAWSLVGSAISPRLAIEYALAPTESKEGRMIPRILS
jgi:DNA polymerase-3 subunit delta'